jgi:RecB family endonuclease NucS
LEFKRKKIDLGVVEQLDRYCLALQEKWYLKTPPIGIIVAPDFSSYELSFATDHGYKCLSYSPGAIVMDWRN